MKTKTLTYDTAVDAARAHGARITGMLDVSNQHELAMSYLKDSPSISIVRTNVDGSIVLRVAA